MQVKKQPWAAVSQHWPAELPGHKHRTQAVEQHTSGLAGIFTTAAEEPSKSKADCNKTKH